MPATYENESYAGIIEALNQVALYNGRPIQSYDPNFNGIIAAILNLGQLGDASLGEYPPFWEVITDDDGTIIGGDFNRPPTNGDLWFDTRQGRLMIYVDDAYYQTNGADVLTRVSSTQPGSEVVGALWYNPDTGSLFVYDGVVWNNVTSSTFSTTQLPLSTPTINRSSSVNANVKVIDEYTPGTDFTQSTLNQWVIKVLGELDAKAYLNGVQSSVRETHAGTNAPTSPVKGHVWYDTTVSALKVFNGSAWVAATNITDLATDIQDLQTNSNQCQASNLARFNTIETSIADLPFSNYATNQSVSDQVSNVESDLTNLTSTVGDLSRFKLKAAANLEHVAIENRLTALENAPGPDLSSYSTLAQLNAAVDALEQTIVGYDYATETYVQTKISEIPIPDISVKLDTSVYNAYVTQADSTFLKRTGGSLIGALTMNHMDISSPTLDFSTSFAAGTKAIAIKAKDAANPAYFGTSTKSNEISWDFTGNEQFTWYKGTKQVFKISGTGIFTPELKIGSTDVAAKLASLESRIAALGG